MLNEAEVNSDTTRILSDEERRIRNVQRRMLSAKFDGGNDTLHSLSSNERRIKNVQRRILNAKF